MAQTWTKEAPKQNGYYWARREGCAPEIVEIEGSNVKSRNIFNEMFRVPLFKTVYRASEWSGPIQLPAKERKPK